MQYLEIKEPIWQPQPSVGISEFFKSDLEIEILWKNTEGKRKFPYRYFIPWDRLQHYPLKSFRSNMPKMRVVPISMLEIKE